MAHIASCLSQETWYEMKILLILWAIGLVTCDKLDRTYLPPPGSAAAGGNLRDLNLPLEYPKEIVTVEPESDITAKSLLNSKYPNIAIGIDRQGPSVTPSSEFFTSHPEITISNIHNVRPTTTSYDLNPASNFSPLETYGSTIRPVSSVSRGSPITTSSSFDPNLSYDQYLIKQNNQQGNLKSIPSSIAFNSVPNDQLTSNIQSEGNKLEEGLLQQNQNFGEFSDTKLPSIEYGDDLLNTAATINPTDDISYFDTYHNQPSSEFHSPQQVYGTVDSRNISSENFYDPIKNGFSSTFGPGQEFFGTPTIEISVPSSKYPLPSNSLQGDVGFPFATNIKLQRAQSQADRNAVILNYENKLTPEGFSYSFDTSNGIHVDESGTATGGVKAKGSYSYTGDDGKIYSIEYTADENGFVPRGDHLPTAPPIPDAILRNIAQAEKNKELGISDDGSYDEAKYGHGRYQGLMGSLQQNQYNNINGQPDINENEQQSINTFENIFPANTANGENGIKKTNENNQFGLDFENGNNKPIPESTNPFKGNNVLNSFIIDENLPTNIVKNSEIFRPIDYSHNSPAVYNTQKDYNDYSGYEYTQPQNMLNGDDRRPSQLPTIDRKEYPQRENKENTITNTVFPTPKVLFNSKQQRPDTNSQLLIQTFNDPSTTPRNINSYQALNDDDELNTDPERKYSTLQPKYISTTSKPYYYNSPYSSNENDEQRNSFPSSTLGPQYSVSTTPYPSEISSRLTSSTSSIGYPQTTPSSQVTSTLRSSVTSGRPATGFTATPSRFTGRTTGFEPVDDSMVSVTEPNAFGQRIIAKPANRGRPRVSVSQVGSPKDFQSGSGISTTPRTQNSRISSRPENFGIPSSTDKTFGEDFRGPKQPQKYDPNNGYYY